MGDQLDRRRLACRTFPLRHAGVALLILSLAGPASGYQATGSTAVADQ
jgi:hypothetical protein